MNFDSFLSPIYRFVAIVVTAILIATTFVFVESAVDSNSPAARADDPPSNLPTNISLGVDLPIFTVTQTPTFTATLDRTISGTGSTLQIIDETTNTVLKSCTSGVTCVTYSKFYTGPAHTYVAKIGSLTSNTVTTSRAAWSITLSADKTVDNSHYTPYLTATANQQTSSTNGSYTIHLFDETTGELLKSCASNTCSAQTVRFLTGGPHTYVALVSAAATPANLQAVTDVQATSNTVSVARWDWAVALTTDIPVLGAGQTATLTATQNNDLTHFSGAYRVYIFDETAGTLVKTCNSSTSCKVTQKLTTGGPHEYVALIGTTGTPAVPAGVPNPQATSNRVTLSRAAWTATIAAPNTTLLSDQTAQITVSTNQNVDQTPGIYSIHLFNKTTGARVGGCGYSPCTVTIPKMHTGPPQDYVAYVAASNSAATIAAVSDIQAESNVITISRAPWTIAAVATVPVFKTNQSGVIVGSVNQSLAATGGTYRTMAFEVDSGKFVGGCANSIVCEVSTGFKSGPSRDYYFVVGRVSAAPVIGTTVIGDVFDIQATSNEVNLDRMPWTLTLSVTQERQTLFIDAFPNQSTHDGGGVYSIYLSVDGQNRLCDNSFGLCEFEAPVNDGKRYCATVEQPRGGAGPGGDIQATACFYNVADTGPELEGETEGGPNPSENCSNACSGDPVNNNTGEFFLNAPDIGVDGSGPALVLDRTYSSTRANVSSPFGKGWTHSLGMKLAFSTFVGGEALKVQVVQENGSKVLFIRRPDGSFFAGKRVMAKLSQNSTTGNWTFTRDRAEIFVFDSDGKLTKIKDRQGNAVDLGYTADRLTSAEASGGRDLAFAWTGDHISEVSDNAGRTVSYGYSASGDLTSVTRMDGRVEGYGYDAGHYMTSLVAPGGATTTNVYNAAKKLWKQTDALGRLTTWVYASSQTTITASDGTVTVEKYSNSQLTQKTLAFGTSEASTFVYQYDSANNLASVADPTGAIRSFEYDGDGNRTKATDPLGRVTEWTYNSDGDLTSVVDPLNRTTTATYGANGLRLSITDPAGAAQTWTYNADGSIATSTDSLGGETSYVYDAQGRLTSTTDAGGRTTTMTLTTAGYVSEVEDPSGATAYTTHDASGRVLTVSDADDNTTSYGYDAAGNLTSVVDSEGATSSWTFDALGRTLTSTDAAGKTTSYGYSVAGYPNQVTDALGNVSTSVYNRLGLVTSSTDALGRTASFLYDGVGRLLATTSPTGRVTTNVYDVAGQLTSTTNGEGATTEFEYDAAGQLTVTTDPLGRETSGTYTPQGQPAVLTLADGSTQSYAYNSEGQVTSLTNPDGKITTYVYGDSGELLSKVEPGGLETELEYDTAGRPKVATLPDGSSTTLSYDGLGRISRVHYSESGSTDTTYTYDASGRPLTMTDSTGTTSFDYEVTGRLATETDGSGDTVGYEYDDIGQLTELTYPGGDTVEYEYDDAGQMISLTDWDNHESTFEWSLDGELVEASTPNGVVETRAYDLVGQLLSAETEKDAAQLAKFSYAYDAAGQLTSTSTVLDGETVDHDYGFDPLSQLSSVITTPLGGSAVTQSLDATSAGLLTQTQTDAELTYNAAQQVTALLESSGESTTFQYDDKGSRTSSTLAAFGSSPALTTEFEYSPSGALESVTTPTKSVDYTSDGRGLRQSRTVSGATSDFTWSTAGGMALLLDDGTHRYIYGPSSTPIAQVDSTSNAFEYLHTDLLGTPRLITDSIGNVDSTSTFDAFGTRISHTGPTDSAIGFTGNLTDADTGLLYLRARDYDPKTGQFLTVDPALDSTHQPYAYTGNNPLQRTDPLGLSAQEVLNNVMSAGAGALDGLSGGVSSVLLEALVPGYDCFIKEYDTAFQIGSVTAQVIEAAIMVATVVVSLGAAAPAAMAWAGAKMAIRAGIKAAATSMKALVKSSLRSTLKSATSAVGRNLPNISTARHYTTREAAVAITKSGQIDVGSSSGKIWLTTDRYASGAEAQTKLALPRQPDGYFEVPLSRVSSPSSSSRVRPMYDQPGGGIEFTTTRPVDVAGLVFRPFGAVE